VRNDCTLICLHAGSFEYIGVRHRATQRLYLSDLIDTHTCQDPGYGKLHVGLYIAALNDAEDRVQLLYKEEEKQKGLRPATGGSGPGHDTNVHDTEGSDSGGGPRRAGGSGGTGHAKRRKGVGADYNNNTKMEQGTQRGRVTADCRDHSVCHPFFLSQSHTTSRCTSDTARSESSNDRLDLPSIWGLRFASPRFVHPHDHFRFA
jgi:hypothetical protein